MSYENGTNFIDYFPKTIEMYKKDNKIFDKTISLLNIYMQKPSWPHCIDGFKDTAIVILGDNPWVVGKYALQLKEFYEDDENKKIDKVFKKDLHDFALMTYNIIDNAEIVKSNPFGLNSISSTDHINGKETIIKISRNDNTTLELTLDRSDIYRVTNFFKELEEKENDREY